METTKNILKHPLVIAVVVFIIGYAYATAQAGHREKSAEIVTEIKVTEVRDALDDKVRTLKMELLDDLATCETGGIKEDKRNGAIILDTNNKMSIGRLMFQRETIIDVHDRYLGVDLAWDEATALAMDQARAYELAEYLIFTKGEISRWHNCNVKLGLSGRINIINQIAE